MKSLEKMEPSLISKDCLLICWCTTCCQNNWLNWYVRCTTCLAAVKKKKNRLKVCVIFIILLTFFSGLSNTLLFSYSFHIFFFPYWAFLPAGDFGFLASGSRRWGLSLDCDDNDSNSNVSSSPCCAMLF